MGETTVNIDELRLRRFINPICYSNLGFPPVCMRNLTMRRNTNIPFLNMFCLARGPFVYEHTDGHVHCVGYRM